MDNLEMLDVLLDYINEHGRYEDLLKWYEMYGHEPLALDKALEDRYINT